jgi:hypothetical protein
MHSFRLLSRTSHPPSRIWEPQEVYGDELLLPLEGRRLTKKAMGRIAGCLRVAFASCFLDEKGNSGLQ